MADRSEEESMVDWSEEEARLDRSEEDVMLDRSEEDVMLDRSEQEARLDRIEEEARLDRSEEDATVERVERELTLPASPGDVWEVVTGSGWLADEVELELVPGGEARFTTQTETRTGWVEDAHAPDETDGRGRLVFWWSSSDGPAARVDLSLEPDGATATRLRVLEERPLEILDLIGMPLPGTGGSTLPGTGGSALPGTGGTSSRGPMMLSLA